MAYTKIYSDADLAEITIGEHNELNATITLVDYDPAWNSRFRALESEIREALKEQVLLLEHVGSTSVPGLPAKPFIDMVLEVPNSADESKYAPALASRGFELRVREPRWHQHRLLELSDAKLHVFSANCEETAQMVRFRDWLRANPAERMAYEVKKRELATQVWKYTQNYADAKTDVIRKILARAVATCDEV